MNELKNEFQISKTIGLEEYDQFMDQNPTEQEYMVVAINKVYKDKKDLKILEIGPGTGRFTKKMIKYFPEVSFHLIEPDKECIIELKKLFSMNENVTIIQNTAEEAVFNSNFDIICMATSFHHIHYKHKEIVLKKIFNSLIADGFFVLSDNFIADYSNEEERIKVLTQYHDKWISDCVEKKDKEGEAMARKMKELVLIEDGGEYFLSPEKFEVLVKDSSLKIAGKVNVTNYVLKEDGNKYFYLMSR
jgi:phospholipid N-methyltransferase